MIKKYRKKPVEISAAKWDGTAEQATHLIEWMLQNGVTANYHCDAETCTGTDEEHVILIYTLEGMMTAQHGDYIIAGVANEFYPCKPDVFAATYEEVSADQEATEQDNG